MHRPVWTRGRWESGQVNPTLLAVQFISLVIALVRGLDYLRNDPTNAVILAKLILAMPLPAWGGLFIAAAVLGVVGLSTRLGALLAAGHLLAMAVYIPVAYGQIQVTGFGPGVRTPIDLFGIGALHGVIGIGIFAILRRREVQDSLDEVSE